MQLPQRVLPVLLLTVSLSICFAQHKDHARQHQQDPDRERFYWQMPERVIKEIGIMEGMIVADVGCGTGYFTLRIAKRVGPTGKVYASDIDNPALQILKKKAYEEKLDNIKIIHGREDNPLLPAGQVDLILLVNVIHLIEDPGSFFSNITPCLKENGYLVIVQWDAEKMDWELSDWDPENRDLFTMRTTLRQIYDVNYEVYQMKTFLPMQNIYFCQPGEVK